MERPERGKPVHDFSGAHILLVEDNEINQDLARELLEGAGLEVDIANDGREAVAMTTRSGRGYDLVLMDIQMPESERIPIAAAQAEILKGSGVHFDPGLVPAFSRSLPEMLVIKEKFADLD